MKTRLIDALPLLAIALVIAAITPRFFPPATDPLEENSDRSKVITVPQTQELPQSEQRQVLDIHDGDTITVKSAWGKEKIRLCGVDADETAKPGKPAQSVHADRAKDYLQQLISQSGDKVAITVIERDRYGRLVSEVWVNPGTDREELTNGLLVLKGLARVYKQYASNCPNQAVLEAAEYIAKQKNVGVWSEANAIPAWEWRRQNKGK